MILVKTRYMILTLVITFALLTFILVAPALATSTGDRITTQNVKSDPLMPQDHVVHDVTLTAQQSDLVGWQEIKLWRYRHAIADLGPAWRSVDLWHSAEPISYRHAIWKFVGAGSMVLYKNRHALLGVRHIVWVKLRNRATGAVVIFNNTHYIAHAWSHRAFWSSTRKLRQRMWLAGRERHRMLIRRWLSEGMTVVGTMDSNRERPPFGPQIMGHRVRYRPAGLHIDWLWTVNANPDQRVDIVNATTLRHRFSDHQGRRMTIKVTVKPQ
jgi:hypothetical protein